MKPLTLSLANSPQASAAAPSGLHMALARLALLQRESVNRLALQEATQAASQQASQPEGGRAALQTVCRHMSLPAARWSKAPDAANLPALIHDSANGRWGVLLGQNAQGAWLSAWPQAENAPWQEQSDPALPGCAFAKLTLMVPFHASKSPVLRVVLEEILRHRHLLIEAAVGGLLITLLATLTSFYSMQIYDRVIPAGAMQTLMVLTLGVLAAVGFEFMVKHLRSRIYEALIEHVDRRLARVIYTRFLAVRLDQMPSEVGGLASQLRGYETVRSFLVGVTTQVLIDTPFALVYAAIIVAIAGPLAFVPLAFLCVAVALGAWHGRHIKHLTGSGHAAANRRTGLLVETVEGAEIIKSTQGGWRMLTRWLSNTDEAREVDLQTRAASEHVQHLVGAFQQVAYILTMAWGAWLVTQSQLSTGALMACAILSGRVLGPCAQMMSQIVAWGYAKAALQGLDRIWALEDDHHGQDTPVVLEQVRGHYRLEQVSLQLGGRVALKVPSLTIQPGERIGVLGPVGAGKTALLRLLSGMYKPQTGRVLLDDLNLCEVAKPSLADQVGHLPQDGRLLAGTLRDNLILGLMDPGDEAILQAARATGLMDAVIANHPQGLQQPIREGGTGLSGGQRQLVNFTRVFLRRPRVWLLDEPTASLDQGTEQRVMAALRHTLGAQDTLILTTHKPELLSLVNRLIVISQHQIVLDGPRDEVLARLQAPVQPT
jgi:ATP-binding cassette, subfamily C, bacterial LapB